MWAVAEEGGFLAADLEEMNWHTLAVDPRAPQQTLTVNQRLVKGSHVFFLLTGANTAASPVWTGGLPHSLTCSQYHSWC